LQFVDDFGEPRELEIDRLDRDHRGVERTGVADMSPLA